MTTRSGTTRVTAQAGCELDDDFLRNALAGVSTSRDHPAPELWEAIGEYVLALAERHARRWQRHACEYQDGFIAGAIEFLRGHPQEVINACSPWGLVVTNGRFAGQRAAGAQATGGLVDRDPVTHRVRFNRIPPVASFDHLHERDDPARVRRRP